MGVEDLAGAVSDEVVRAARREPVPVAFGGDERGARFVGQGAAGEVRVGQGLLARGDDDVAQPGVGGDGVGPFEFGLADAAVVGDEVVEGDGEQPSAGAVAEGGAGQAGQAGGEQRQRGGGAASGEVGADAGGGAAAGGAAVGGAHAGHGAGVEAAGTGVGGVPGGGEAGADGFDERVPYALDGLVGRELGGGDGERRRRLVTGDVAGAVAQDEGVPGRHAAYALVGRAVGEGLRGVGAGEEGGEVADVELGLDEVGEGQGGGGVGGAAGPGGVEDGPGAGQVARDGGAAAHLGDGGVAAGPGGEVPQGASAGGDEPGAQLLVAGAAAAEDGEAGEGVEADDADLVGAPVADGPEGGGVAPQELGADGVDGRGVVVVVTAVGAGGCGTLSHGPRGGAAPPHHPAHDASTGCGQPTWTTDRAPRTPTGRPSSAAIRSHHAQEATGCHNKTTTKEATHRSRLSPQLA